MSKHSIQSSNNGTTIRVGAGYDFSHDCNTTDFIVTYDGDRTTHDHVVVSDSGNVLYSESYRPNKN